MKMQFLIRAIPAAAAMSVVLMVATPIQAQSGAQSASPPPNAPNTTSDNAPVPANPGANTSGQRNANKPMTRQGSMAGHSAGTENTSLSNGGGGDQPVRQADKVSKNKSERMMKGDKAKSSMSKSKEPVREADLKEEKK
jgi:hypothetical protein